MTEDQASLFGGRNDEVLELKMKLQALLLDLDDKDTQLKLAEHKVQLL